MKFDTIKEACQLWVERDMNQVPMSVVEKLMQVSDYSDITEITPPSKYDHISIFSGDYAGEDGEIVRCVGDDEYIVELDSSKYPDPVTVFEDEFETMWEFKDICDKEWLENNLQAVADCGFRIYESEDYGYLIGIDGAGYDFYEAHFLPLYKARGLHWHTEDKEESENE